MGGKFDKTCGKRIKLDQKFDETGYHRDQDRISELESDIIIIAIGRRFRNQIGYHRRCNMQREFLDSLYKVRVSVNSYLFFCLWALFPLCCFSDRYENNIVKFLVFF